MRLDCFRRDPQVSGDLAVIVIQANQGGDLLLARRERPPLLQAVIGRLPLI
jgi:hypothetical protein